MKKLFASKQESQYEGYIGKHYGVGELSLVVEEVIAEGGFSYVFLVRESSKNKIWALKRMLVNSVSDLENCKQEINMLKQFHRHPSIVTFKGHHTKHMGNGIYEILLLMQHCPNGTVVDLMNQHISIGFSEDLIRSIYIGIVEAVSLLHANGYVHRDLKVENILIGPNKEFVLCDFGSAYKGILDPEAQGHSFVEENINKFTTLAYRSPEMCDLYLGYKIGPSSDVWALGVLLYKLCFFTTPFEENTLAIARAKYTIPDPDKYSKQLISVIHDTLLVDPSKRLTAKQISSRLKGKNSSTPTTTATPSLPSPSCSSDITSRDPPRDTPPTEESVKARSRPRGHRQGQWEGILIAPPASTPPHEAVTSRHEAVTSRGNEERRVKRHSNPQASPDPWGNTATSPRTPTSLIFLPPPPSSPSHKPRRGHSRAKSDTTFLKNISNPMCNPFLWEAEKKELALSASTGQLSGGGPSYHPTTPSYHPPQRETSADNCGFTSNFTPSPSNVPVEDEFLKLSLRGNSQTKLNEIPAETPGDVKQSKSTKVTRAQSPAPREDPQSSRGHSLSLRHRAFSNEEMSPLSRTLSSPGGPGPALSMTSLFSLDSAPKKRSRALSLFGRRKTMSREMITEKVLQQEQFVNKHSGSYRKSVVGNPLHGDLM